MRNELLTSAGLHVLAVAACFIGAHSSRSVVLPGSDVVEVALIGAAPPEHAQAPTPRAPEQVTPQEEQGVRLEKAPRQPAPPAPKPDAERSRAAAKPAEAAPAHTTLASEAIGGGMRGDVVVDGDFTFGFYLQRIRSLIAANWSPPTGNTTGTRVELYFRVARDGTLSAPSVETASGNDYFDQTALRAVLVTAKLPPLPQGYAGSDLGVHLGFEYSGP